MFINVYSGPNGTASMMVNPRRAVERDNSYNEVTCKLGFNFYPNARSLVNNLNELVVDNMYKIARMQHSEEEFEKVFDFHEVSEIVSYISVDLFQVKLSKLLLKVLN